MWLVAAVETGMRARAAVETRLVDPIAACGVETMTTVMLMTAIVGVAGTIGTVVTTNTIAVVAGAAAEVAAAANGAIGARTAAEADLGTGTTTVTVGAMTVDTTGTIVTGVMMLAVIAVGEVAGRMLFTNVAELISCRGRLPLGTSDDAI